MTAEQQERFFSERLRRTVSQIYRIVQNIADAQDLAQEAFIKAFQHQEQLKDQQKAAQWLARIATNIAIDFLRRGGRASFCELEESHKDHFENPEQVALRSEQRAYLEDALRRLSPRERAALMLRDVEDIPVEDVARYLNCSKATVRSHITNGRSKLRRHIEGSKRRLMIEGASPLAAAWAARARVRGSVVIRNLNGKAESIRVNRDCADSGTHYLGPAVLDEGTWTPPT